MFAVARKLSEHKREACAHDFEKWPVREMAHVPARGNQHLLALARRQREVVLTQAEAKVASTS